MDIVSDNFKYESVQDTGSVLAYLEAIVEGFRSGRLTLSKGEEEMVCQPQGLVGFSLEAKAKGERRKLSIKLGWKEPSGPREPMEQLSISINPAGDAE